MLDVRRIDQLTEALADAPHVPAMVGLLDEQGLEEVAAAPLDRAGAAVWRLRRTLQRHGHELARGAGLRDLAPFPLEEPELQPLRAWVAGRARQRLLRHEAPATPDELRASLVALSAADALSGRALLAVYDRDADLASAHHEALKPHSVATALDSDLPSSVRRLLWGVALDAWLQIADQHVLHDSLLVARPRQPDLAPLWDRLQVQWQRATDLAGRGGSAPGPWRVEPSDDGRSLAFVADDGPLGSLAVVPHPPPRPLRLAVVPTNRTTEERVALERDLCAHGLQLLRRSHGPSACLGRVDPVDDAPRVLALLDEHLAAEPSPDAWAGWRVERVGSSVRMTEVRCTLGSDGQWKVRGRRRADEEALGTLPADHSARRHLATSPQLGDPPLAPVVGALDALVGHPRLFVGATGSVPLKVRRRQARLLLRQRERGVVTSWSVDADHDPLESSALVAMVRQEGDGRRGLLWPDATTVWVVDAGLAVPVAAAMSRAADWVPPAAVDGLLERLPGIAARAGVDLDPALAGEQRPADPTPRLRLDAQADGGLVVELRVAPGGVPLGQFPPGRGPVSLFGADPVRFVVRRDPDEEERAAAELERRLGLAMHRHVDHRYELELVDAVEVMQRLADHPEVVVEWASPPMRVHSASHLGQLVVRIEDRGRWFRLQGELKAGPAGLPLTELLRRIRAGQHCIVLDQGQVVALAQELRRDLLTLATLAEPVAEGEAMAIHTAPLLADLVDRGLDAEVPPAWGDRLHALAHPGPAPPFPELQATLRPYQAQGVAWLQQLASWAPGGVLADDMGLGKTVQALALLVHRAGEGRALVVVPTSILATWQRAVERFAPQLRVHLGHGPRRLREPGTLGAGDVLLTSWGTLVRDAPILAEVDFATVVLDEAQAIKNAGAVRSRAVRGLRRGFTLALTGTPMENGTHELWALFDAVVPGLLGDEPAFHTRFATPIAHQPGGPVAQTLSALVRPFLLRRRKAEVADELPPRIEVEVPVALPPAEREAYEQVRAAAVASLSDRKARSDRRRILAAITRLRQLACHPRLVDDSAPASSAKVRAVRRTLLELHDTGQRALVFSQFTRLLDLLADHLAPDGLRIVRLDGRMSTAERQRSIDAFQAGDAEVFLISLHAGGTGLNLTAASAVLHLDAWWNPAVHDQASDRAHRIGQDRAVTVFHFATEDTVEQGIRALQRDKRDLVERVLQGTDQPARLGLDELMSLLEAGGVSELSLGSPELPAAPSSWPDIAADPAAVAALLGDLRWPLDDVPERLVERFERWLTRMHRQREPRGRNHARAAWRLLRWCASQGRVPEHVDDLESAAMAYANAVQRAEGGPGSKGDQTASLAAVRAWLGSRA
jgi:superfamily II DNA or RNA helicase